MTLETFKKTGGLSLTERRKQNTNIAALQTAVDTQTVTAGVVTASKAVIVDANKDVGDFRNLDVVNLDAGSSGVSGTVDIFPGLATSGKLSISCGNQTGDTTVSLVAGAMAAARTITLRDPGATASLLTTTDTTAAATTSKAIELSLLDGVMNTQTMTSTPASGSCACQFTFKEADGATSITSVQSGLGYISSSAGAMSTAVTSVAVLTNGGVETIVTGKLFQFVTTAAGLLGVTVTATAGTYYITFILPNGKITTSSAIVVN